MRSARSKQEPTPPASAAVAPSADHFVSSGEVRSPNDHLRVAAQAAAARAQVARHRLAWVAEQRRLLAARRASGATALKGSASTPQSGIEIGSFLLPDGRDHRPEGRLDGDGVDIRRAVAASPGDESP